MTGHGSLSVRRLRPSSKDGRGSITSIFDEGAVRRLAVVHSKKGSVRGNHYHKRAGHYVYVLEGRLKLVARLEGKTKSVIMSSGSLVWVPPIMPHSFVALTNTTALEFGPEAYSADDTVPLQEPLVKPARSRR